MCPTADTDVGMGMGTNGGVGELIVRSERGGERRMQSEGTPARWSGTRRSDAMLMLTSAVERRGEAAIAGVCSTLHRAHLTFGVSGCE